MDHMVVVAWVPRLAPDAEADWNIDHAVAVAVGWVEEQCALRSTHALVITSTAREARSNKMLAEFTQRHRGITQLGWRGQEDLNKPINSPLLVFKPSAATLEFAMNMAERYKVPLCAIEGEFPIRLWLGQSHAIDLSRPIDPYVSDRMELLLLAFRGNGSASDTVKPILAELRSRLDDHIILQLLAARGMSPKGLKRTKYWIDELIFEPASTHEWLSPFGVDGPTGAITTAAFPAGS